MFCQWNETNGFDCRGWNLDKGSFVAKSFLTKLMCTVGRQLVEKSPVLYESWRFTIMFKRGALYTIPWADNVFCTITFSFLMPHFNITFYVQLMSETVGSFVVFGLLVERQLSYPQRQWFAHFILLDLATINIFGEQHKLHNPFLWKYYRPSVPSFPLGQNASLNVVFSQLRICYFRTVRNQVKYKYKSIS
jgi:hypothetical protein